MKLQDNDRSAVKQMRDPVFQVAGVGLALLDFEGRFLRVNPALEGLVGTSEDELLGKSLPECCQPTHARICFDMIQELSLSDRAVQDQELNLKTTKGGVLWVHVTASRLKAGGALPSCIVLTVHDSSDYFELQEEMQTSSKHCDIASSPSRLSS